MFYFKIGTESERSYTGRDSQRRLLRQTVAGNGKPIKIAGIGKQHKVSRYLSRECEFFILFICYRVPLIDKWIVYPLPQFHFYFMANFEPLWGVLAQQDLTENYQT